MVLEIWVPAAIAQIATSLISFLASTAIAAMIYKPSNGGLKTPYRRIIFGLSIADIFKSFGLLVGPWFVPSSENGTWGLGSARSCQFDGWILTVGGNAGPMYLMFLSLYYLCKLGPLKYRMTDECFYKRLEARIHALIVVSNIALASAALVLDIIHPSVIGSVCYYATSPRGCDIMADVVGECDTTSTAYVHFFDLTMVIWLPILSLAAIIVLTTLVSCHVRTWDQSIQRQSQTPTTPRISNITRGRYRNEESDFESIGRNIGVGSVNDASEVEEGSHVNAQEGMQHLSRVYVAQHSIQAICYIGTFCLVYLPMVIGLLILRRKAKLSYSLQLLSHIAYPFGGFLNILVYTRPMVVYLRREKPEFSWLQGFLIILQSGGDLPTLSTCELLSSKCDFVCFLCCSRHHDGGNDGLPLHIVIEEESTPISSIPSYSIPSEPIDFSILSSNYSAAAINGCSVSHKNSDVLNKNVTPDNTLQQTETGNGSGNIQPILPSLDPWIKALDRAKKLGGGC